MQQKQSFLCGLKEIQTLETLMNQGKKNFLVVYTILHIFLCNKTIRKYVNMLILS